MKKICFLILVSMIQFLTSALGEDSCPFAYVTSKENTETFSGLKNFYKMMATIDECSKVSEEGLKTVEDLKAAENALAAEKEKCFKRLQDFDNDKKTAIDSVEKGNVISSNLPYVECNPMLYRYIGQTINKDQVIKCINDKHQELSKGSAKECENKKISKETQDKINSSTSKAGDTLSSSLSFGNPCGINKKSLLNGMDQVKAFASYLPWGKLATDAGTMFLNMIPEEDNKAAVMHNDLLREESYENSACLYYDIQQKLYCSDTSKKAIVFDPKCFRDRASNDLIKLLENVQEIKTATDLVAMGRSQRESAERPDTSMLEIHIDDLIKYAIASESELRERLKFLPKVQQSIETEKLDDFYRLLAVYQMTNLEDELGREYARKVLEELAGNIYGNAETQGINFEVLLYQSTPGLTLGMMRKDGMVNALVNLGKVKIAEQTKNAGLSTHKKNFNEIGVGQMMSQLNKKYNEFQTHMEEKVKGKVKKNVNDPVAEEKLREVIRHCLLLQEIYDPQFVGKIPNECGKLNCGKENRLQWFSPIVGENNVALFKKSFCEKSKNIKEIENRYITELNDENGARVCGQKASVFFSSSSSSSK